MDYIRYLFSRIRERRRDVSEVALLGYAVLIISFFLQIVIARILGVEEFGRYVAVLSIIVLIESPLVTRGAEVALRELGMLWSEQKHVEFSCLSRKMVEYDSILYIGATFVLIFISHILSYLFEFDEWLFYILVFMIPAQIGYGVFKSYFTIFGKINHLARYELTYTVLMFGLSVLGASLFGVYGLAVSMVVSMVLKTTLAYYITRDFAPKHPFLRSDKTFACISRDSAFPIIRNFLVNGLNQIDIVVIGLLQRPEVVGIYKVGKSLSMLPLKISFPVWRFIQPQLLESIQSGNQRRLRRIIISASSILLAIMILVFPVLYLYGSSILVFLYGAEYEGAFSYFIILLIGMWLFHGLTGWFKLWMIVTGSQFYGIRVYGIALLLASLLGFLFAGESVYAMAYIMSGIFVAISILAYLKVFLDD